MYLFQILLPLYTKDNRRIEHAAFTKVKDELTKRYGGVTAYTRAPAEGQWITRGRKDRDQIIIIEVMAQKRSLPWWRRYRKILETRFKQDSIIVRYSVCHLP
jgi:hypothetical protein